MNDFVQLWVYLASTPLFGLTATIAVYVVAHAVYERVNRMPLANPVLWSVVAIGLMLLLTRTPYPTYFAGAQFVHVLLGPAVVALAWPMWARRQEFRQRARPLLIAATLGGLAAAGSAVVMGWAFELPADVLKSLAPKSATAPVAMGIAERIGGIPALAAVLAIVTGITGALSARRLFDLLRVDAMWIRGFALGTASHGIGAARAMQVDVEAGAYAGVALGLQVFVASVCLPLIARWL
jgi:predicted murein hydrolase (TIGR00659 family)